MLRKNAILYEEIGVWSPLADELSNLLKESKAPNQFHWSCKLYRDQHHKKEALLLSLYTKKFAFHWPINYIPLTNQ